MTTHWLSVDHVFDGREIHAQAALRIEDARVVEISSTHCSKNTQHVRGLVTPGFVDLQVNGGGGVMLNNTPTAKGIRQIAKAHRQLGTVAMLPTVITDQPGILDLAADAAIETWGERGIIGLHIEGPHISLERRGTHKAEYIRPLDDRTISIVERLRNAGVPVMLTLAPEMATAEQIAHLTAIRTVISIGHTNATSGVVNQAIESGACCATHLYNAMSPMTSRAAGAVGAVINSPVYAGVICDGHHVADDMIRLAIRARRLPDRMFIVSDAMATVGGPDSFELYEQKISLNKNRLINSEGNLAGAHITMAQSVARLVKHTGIPLVDALRMATSTPATCIGAPELGYLLGRSVDELLILDDQLTIQEVSLC